MAALLPAFLCLASGFALVSLGWSRRGSLVIDQLLRASLAVGFGLGIFSIVYFVSRACGFSNLLAVDVSVLIVLVAVVAIRVRFLTTPSDATRTAEADPSSLWLRAPAWLRRAVGTAFVLALIAAIDSAILRVRAYPNGDGWDAFAIWNLHARFLFLGGPHWRDGFTALLPGSHPDYPLLLPSAIAHFWTYLGHDATQVPAVLGIAFTFATAGLLFAGLELIRGRLVSLLGAIVLLSTPFFIEQGTAQYADVPLSFFFLAATVMTCLADDTPAAQPGLLAMAGLAAGFAAWTKNEGLLFLCALAISRIWILARRPSGIPRTGGVSATPMLAVLVAAFFAVLYYKHFIGVRGDLFSTPSEALHRLLDPTRYWAITKWYVKGFFRFGHWLLIPGSLLLLVLALVGRMDSSRTQQPGSRTIVLTIALTLAGYAAIFLITPYDIYWHLRFSLLRLFLQVWPSVVFLILANIRIDFIGQPGSPPSVVNQL